MNHRQRGKKIGATLIAILIISIVTLTVAYAALSETLSIQGSAKVNASNWNIKLENSTSQTNSKTGTATYTTPVVNGTTISYSVGLTKPSDSATLYFDVLNNGDIGIISRIVLHPKKEVYIDFDYGTVKYTPANFNKFRLAYAISIHKAQGSEFDIVIMPIVKNYNKMLYRKLVYTGVTRSKKKLYIIGDFSALDIAVANTSVDIRRTTIKDFLINGIK